jgi:hypothetical protein
VVELQRQTQPRTEAPSDNLTGRSYVTVLSVTPQRGKVEVVVRFPSGAVHTAELPGFAESLASHLPSILCTRCRCGSDGLFAAELPHTETGHALEHAILAFLERDGLRCRAVTEWNWRREPWGTFHIALFGKHIGVRETMQALRPAVALVESAIAQSMGFITSLGRPEAFGSAHCHLQPGMLRGGGEDPENS